MKAIAAMPLLGGLRWRKSPTPPPFPVNVSGTTYWHNGRVAIWHAIRRLGLPPDSRVLVPAYCCGSEVDAVLKARMRADYYRVGPDLRPDLDHLAQLAAREPVAALLVTNYFGFAQPLEEIRAFTRQLGAFLIEDNAHGLLSQDPAGRWLGSRGDVGIFSLVKTLPIPDGGVLMVNPDAGLAASTFSGTAPDRLKIAGRFKFLLEKTLSQRYQGTMRHIKRYGTDPLTAAIKRLRKAKLSAGTSPTNAPADDANYRHIVALREESIQWRMSRLARALLPHFDYGEIIRHRRDNFLYLAEHFPDSAALRPLFAALPQNTCPLFFPVRCAEPRALQQHLAAARIESKWFWSFVHPTLRQEDFPEESRLKQTVVALPIHQDLAEDDLDRILATLRDWPRDRASSAGASIL